jgi:molybdopterin synthase sulfur carrier subunit
MAVNVRIPPPLRTLTKGAEEVEAQGDTVSQILEDLEDNYKGISARLFDDQGQVRRFINVFLNDEDIRFLDNLDTQVKDGDELSIVPAIAGGR